MEKKIYSISPNYFTGKTIPFLAANLAICFIAFSPSFLVFLSNIAKSLKSGGIFAVILDKSDIYEGYILNIAKDEFIHSMEYFEEVIKISGLRVEDKKDKDIEGRKFNIIVAKKLGN